jgi:hypothetical protein
MIDTDSYLGLKRPAPGPVTPEVFLYLLSEYENDGYSHNLDNYGEFRHFFLTRVEPLWLEIFFNLIIKDGPTRRYGSIQIEQAGSFGDMATLYPEQGLDYLMLLLGDPRYRAFGIEALECFEHPSRQIGLDYLAGHEAELDEDCRKRWRKVVFNLSNPGAWRDGVDWEDDVQPAFFNTAAAVSAIF